MMIQFVLALLTIGTVDPVPDLDTAVSQQIEVIGERLKSWRGTVKSKDGKLSCDIRDSTGDAEIDKIGCEALMVCTLDIKPRLDAVSAMDLPRKERNRRIAELLDSRGPCFIERRDNAIDALAQERADAL